MNKSELLKIIEDEVSAVLREPIREPEAQQPIQPKIEKPIAPKPSLQNEEEIDDFFFRAGKKKHEI